MCPGRKALVGLVSGESMAQICPSLQESSWIPLLCYGTLPLPPMLLAAHSTFYSAMPKPKQAKVRQDDLIIWPQLVQPLGGATSHLKLDLNNFGLNWMVQQVQQVS